jgi:uncharacterized membrane protein
VATDRQWNDQRVEAIIGGLLRAGVLLSAFVVVCGAAIYLVRHGGSPANYRVFHGEPDALKSVAGILHYTFALRGRGMIQLGLLLLIATPVARVAFSAFAFAAKRDWMYASFSLLVLAILLYSLFGSSMIV